MELEQRKACAEEATPKKTRERNDAAQRCCFLTSSVFIMLVTLR